MSAARSSKGRQGSRLLRWTVLLLVAVTFGVTLIPVGMGFLLSWGVTHPFCSHGPAPETFGLTYENVRVSTRIGVALEGYFIPGSNGATIIVPPAYGQDRGGWLAEASLLADAGFNVLTFDSRPCAGISPHSLGYWEAADILDALDYLRHRDDVDMARVGLHGFSQAGASNLFAAALSDEVRAAVAEGGYVDYGAQTLGVGSRQDLFTLLFTAGAQIGYRASTGLDMGVLSPVHLLGDIAPRQVMLVYGTRESTLAGARQAAAAYDHVRLWEVEGASHGTYLSAAGADAFNEHVVTFFEQTLLAE